MTGKPPIKNYDTILEWLVIYQKHKCSGCGEVFRVKPDLAHYLARTDDNLKKYPLFLDSILNLSAQDNFCNVNHITQYGKEPMTDLEAQTIETYLQNNQAVSEWCNNPNQREYDFNEIMKEIFGKE